MAVTVVKNTIQIVKKSLSEYIVLELRMGF